MIIVIFLWTVFFVLLDEVVMGTVQRRIGPLVIGFYGLLSSIINGINLMIAQFRIPKVHFNLGFNFFPIIFFSFSIFCFSMNYPFFFFDNGFSLLVFGIISFFGIIFLILSAFAGLSKYNMLGCMRLISQLLSYELVWSTIILGIIISFHSSLSLSNIFHFACFASLKRWLLKYFSSKTVIYLFCIFSLIILPLFLKLIILIIPYLPFSHVLAYIYLFIQNVYIAYFLIMLLGILTLIIHSLLSSLSTSVHRHSMVLSKYLHDNGYLFFSRFILQFNACYQQQLFPLLLVLVGFFFWSFSFNLCAFIWSCVLAELLYNFFLGWIYHLDYYFFSKFYKLLNAYLILFCCSTLFIIFIPSSLSISFIFPMLVLSYNICRIWTIFF